MIVTWFVCFQFGIPSLPPDVEPFEIVMFLLGFTHLFYKQIILFTKKVALSPSCNTVQTRLPLKVRPLNFIVLPLNFHTG